MQKDLVALNNAIKGYQCGLELAGKYVVGLRLTEVVEDSVGYCLG